MRLRDVFKCEILPDVDFDFAALDHVEQMRCHRLAFFTFRDMHENRWPGQLQTTLGPQNTQIERRHLARGIARSLPPAAQKLTDRRLAYRK